MNELQILVYHFSTNYVAEDMPMIQFGVKNYFLRKYRSYIDFQECHEFLIFCLLNENIERQWATLFVEMNWWIIIFQKQYWSKLHCEVLFLAIHEHSWTLLELNDQIRDDSGSFISLWWKIRIVLKIISNMHWHSWTFTNIQEQT